MKDGLRALAASVGGRIQRELGALESFVDRDLDPYHIVAYRGYGRPGRVLVLGRVLQDERLLPAAPGHSKLRNLVAMLKCLESDPLPVARVRAHLPEGNREQVADDEGYIRAWLELNPEKSGWNDVPLELTEPGHRAAIAKAPVLTPHGSASFGVISDMDDTVLQSEVTNFIRAARMGGPGSRRQSPRSRDRAHRADSYHRSGPVPVMTSIQLGKAALWTSRQAQPHNDETETFHHGLEERLTWRLIREAHSSR